MSEAHKPTRPLLNIVAANPDLAWVHGYLLPSLGLTADQYMLPSSLELGRSLATELERSVDFCRFTLLVIGAAFGSEPQQLYVEMMASFASLDESRLICLTLTKEPLPLRLRARVSLDCSDPQTWVVELGRLRQHLALSVPTEEPLGCPYRGMAPYSATDAKYFHGREAEVDELLVRIAVQQRLLLIGPSGSGKSSLVGAGLLAALAERTLYRAGYFLVRQFRPGASPISALRHALGGVLDDSALPGLISQGGASRVLLIIDQLEEVFTTASKEESVRFLRCISTLRESTSLTVLLVLRADFFPDLMLSALWPVDASERVELAPLHGEALRRAIRLPAQTCGVFLEDALIERLMADASDEPGALPLLQATLELLWDRRQRLLLSLRAYETLGQHGASGLSVAIARRADAAIAALSPLQRDIARRILIRLVQFGEGRPDTRRQRPTSALRAAEDSPENFEQALQHLAQHRLLTLTAPEEALAERLVDISHESLIRSWPAMQKWMQERRSAEVTRRWLEERSREWHKRQGRGAFLDEAQLRDAEEWMRSSAGGLVGLDSSVVDLIRTSRELLEMKKRTKRTFLKLTSICLACLSGIMIAYNRLSTHNIAHSVVELYQGGQDPHEDQNGLIQLVLGILFIYLFCLWIYSAFFTEKSIAPRINIQRKMYGAFDSIGAIMKFAYSPEIALKPMQSVRAAVIEKLRGVRNELLSLGQPEEVREHFVKALRTQDENKDPVLTMFQLQDMVDSSESYLQTVPYDQQMMRIVAVSQLRLGDALGDNSGAKVAYDRALHLAASIGPDSVFERRSKELAPEPDELESNELLGEHMKLSFCRRTVLEAAENPRATFETHKKYLGIDLAMLPGARRSLATDYIGVFADVLESLGMTDESAGRLESAASHYELSLNLRFKLVQYEPGNGVWQRDLAKCHQTLGMLKMSCGDQSGAVEHFQAQVNILQRQPGPGVQEQIMEATAYVTALKRKISLRASPE